MTHDATAAEDEREHRAMEILAEAVDLDGSDRRRFLDEVCGGDGELRREVEALLAGESELDGGFLERPAAVDLADTVTHLGPATAVPRSRMPERLGVYRVIRQLGRGGMGTVYLGEQEKPVRRRVALKVMEAIEDRTRRKRFAAECQALARLNHPHVASLYFVGTTGEEEQPFVAMELVEGPAITTWCNEQHLTVRRRIELFLGVCAGVRHAHEKGILHRDLKASNVLVGEVDGRPVAKVIDFGIAFALDEPLLSGSTTQAMTLEHQIVGSPAYLSPEAASGDRDLDTRSDVYALGLLLYELLVGVHPLDSGQDSLPDLLRRLAKEERPPPSERFAGLDEGRRRAIAAYRSLTPGRLARRVRGDLDAIVSKALAVDRAERYSSPADLASDLERHLAHEPVAARPPAAAYRLRRFLRRRAGVVASIALLIVVLAAGVVGRTREARRANLEAQRARQALAESEAVSEFLAGLFEVADPRQARGETVTARELLDRGAEQLRSSFADQPLTRARFLGSIGTIYQQLGLYDGAESLLAERLALHEAELGADHPTTADSVQQLAGLYLLAGRSAEAEPLFRRVLALRGAAAAGAPAAGAPAAGRPARSQLELADTLGKLGRAILDQGRFDEAEPFIQRAVDILEAVPGAVPAETAAVIDRLGAVYDRQGRLDEAEPLRLRALALRRLHLGEDHPDVASSLDEVGVLYRRQGRTAEAEAHLEQALAIRERVLGPDHPHTASSLDHLGSLYHDEGRHAQAERLLRRALEIRRRTLGPGHPRIADSLTSLAGVLVAGGGSGEAEGLLAEALAIREQTLGRGHPDTAESVAALATVLRRQRRFAEAEPLYRRALGALETSRPLGDPAITSMAREYAVLLRALGRDAEAAALEARVASGEP